MISEGAVSCHVKLFSIIIELNEESDINTLSIVFVWIHCYGWKLWLAH